MELNILFNEIMSDFVKYQQLYIVAHKEMTGSLQFTWMN